MLGTAPSAVLLVTLGRLYLLYRVSDDQRPVQVIEIYICSTLQDENSVNSHRLAADSILHT